MNIVDDITEVVRNAPLMNLEVAFINSIDQKKIEDYLKVSDERRALVRSFVTVYDDAIKRGISPLNAATTIMCTHEDMLRYVIMKDLRGYLLNIGADNLHALKVATLNFNMDTRIKAVSDELTALESQAKKMAQGLPISQFAYSLKYAADKWGNDTEKKYIKSLVKKIEFEDVKK